MEIKSLCFNIHASARVELCTDNEHRVAATVQAYQSLQHVFTLEPDFICPSAARNVTRVMVPVNNPCSSGE